MKLPQLIDLLANSFGHLNAINHDKLPIPAQQRMAFAMNYLQSALQQLDIDIENYKM